MVEMVIHRLLRRETGLSGKLLDGGLLAWRDGKKQCWNSGSQVSHFRSQLLGVRRGLAVSLFFGCA
jgi:hypothetical protein